MSLFSIGGGLPRLDKEMKPPTPLRSIQFPKSGLPTSHELRRALVNGAAFFAGYSCSAISFEILAFGDRSLTVALIVQERSCLRCFAGSTAFESLQACLSQRLTPVKRSLHSAHYHRHRRTKPHALYRQARSRCRVRPEGSVDRY